jgi:hypothetical protein
VPTGRVSPSDESDAHEGQTAATQRAPGQTTTINASLGNGPHAQEKPGNPRVPSTVDSVGCRRGFCAALMLASSCTNAPLTARSPAHPTSSIQPGSRVFFAWVGRVTELPITITRFGIPKSEQAGDGLTNVPVAIYPDVYAVPSVGGVWQPVRPLTLQPRQMAGVEMRVTLTKCWSSVKWNAIPVTFTVYGIERHVIAPMNVQIDLVGSKTVC